MRRRLGILIAAALAASGVAATSAGAQDSARVAPPAPSEVAAIAAPPESLGLAPPSAPVFLGGHEVLRILSARDGIEPARRAALIRKRLDAAVADESVPLDSLRLVSTPQGIEFRMGPHFLGVVTPGDLRGVEPPLVASRILELLEQVRAGIARERADRRPSRILLSVGLVIAFTLVAWILVRLLLRAGRWWRAWLRKRVGPRLPALHLGGYELLSQAQITRLVAVALGWLEIPLILVLVDLTLSAIFSRFPLTQSWGWRLQQFALQAVLRVVAVIGSALPGLVAIAAILIVFRWLTRISDQLFLGVEEGRVRLAGLHPDLARPTRRLVNVGLWLVAAAIAFPFIPGSQSRAVQGISVLVGITVSLGSTSVMGNMIAGLVLTYSRAFKVGDLIKFGEHVGTVTGLGTFATKLRSIRNEELTIPNGQLAGTAILNYTRLAREDGLILHTQVTIGYDAEWRKVHALLIEAAQRVAGIEHDPKPWVYQRSLNDSHITYELCCVTRAPTGLLKAYSDLHEQVQDAFSRAGLEILSPAYHAIRDANAPVLPAEPAGPREAPGGFRVRPGG